MADDQSALLVEIGVTQARMERELAKVVKAGVVSAQQIEKSFGAANTNIVAGAAKIGPAFQRGTAPATAAVKNTSGAVSNLTSQLNDIGVQLAGGQSPFLIMLQQGTQISQLFTQTGTTIKGFGGILANAAMSALNPFSLLTFAVIGLGGAAVQYFASVVSGGADSEKALQEQETAIRGIAKSWGSNIPALQAYIDKLDAVKRSQDAATASQAITKDLVADTAKIIKDIGVQYADVTSIFSQSGIEPDAIIKFQDAYNKLRENIEKGKATQEDFNAVIAATQDIGIKGNQSIDDFVGGLESLRGKAVNTASEVEGLNKSLSAMNLTPDQGKTMLGAAIGQFTGLGQAGGNAITGLVEDMAKGFVPAVKRAIDEIDRLMDNFSKLQEQVNKSPLGTLPPLFAGGGQFMNEEQSRNFDANEARLREAGNSSTAQSIRGAEGFRSKAYWDVNAYRAGFGSDTVTRANGMIEKVTAETVVTLDDAERDLSRRILEFQSGVQDSIGSDTWRSLNEGQQAALTSIAYNYGSLPKRIVAAIQSGGGPEVVAKAIADLGTDNGGINAKRRRNEAQQYLTGTGLSAADAGISTGGKERGATAYADEVQRLKERTATLRESASAQAAINPMINDYGYALEKARAEQQLLADAERQKLTITPELREEISGLASAYAEASAGAKRLDASQATIRENAQKWAGIEKDVFGGFLKDIKDGVKASEALGNALQRLGDKLLDAGLDALFDPKAGVGGGGGILGSLFSGIGKIFGWETGTSNTGGSKGQPRGVVHGQEAVIPMADGDIPVKIQQPDVKETRRHASRDTVDIRLADDSGRMASVADQRIQTASGTIVRVATETAYKTVKKDMANLMSDAQARN